MSFIVINKFLTLSLKYRVAISERHFDQWQTGWHSGNAFWKLSLFSLFWAAFPKSILSLSTLYTHWNQWSYNQTWTQPWSVTQFNLNWEKAKSYFELRKSLISRCSRETVCLCQHAVNDPVPHVMPNRVLS